jgi:hypothetical protein
MNLLTTAYGPSQWAMKPDGLRNIALALTDPEKGE